MKKNNESLVKLYKNIINKIIENKKNNLKKHLSFNISNIYKEKNFKRKTSIKKLGWLKNLLIFLSKDS